MNASRTKVLIIEDDPQIQRFLTAALESHDFATECAATGADGLRLATLQQPDIVIADLGLPDISGLEVIKRLREWFGRPIIVLSARSQESDKVSALDNGADDYLTKPFGVAELLARMRVAMRHGASRGTADDEPRIDIGGLTIDLGARRVQRDGTDIHLTPIEYKLLVALVRHRGKVITHRQLLRDVWGPAHVESPHYLRIYMRSLRQKIEINAAQPRYLLTEVGVGYRFADT